MTATVPHVDNAAPLHSVLIVDDEQGIVNALRRELSTPPLGRYRYAIECFTDPVAALQRATEKTFEAVITDYRMPEMNGLELLKALHEVQPDCMRLVLSGQTDLSALVEMINQTQIFRFIPKPWSSYFLKTSLMHAIDLRTNRLNNRRMAQALRDHGINLPLMDHNTVDQILVVDDDLDVAHAVARQLSHPSRFDEVYSDMHSDETKNEAPRLNPKRIGVPVTDSPLHALQLADELVFSCVISDYLMPEMDGGAFLKAFAEKQPDTVLILLSGAANFDQIVNALDLGHIDYFLGKPWDAHELRAAVANALLRRRLDLDNQMLAKMCKERGIVISNH